MIGYPIAALQELLDLPVSPSPLASEASGADKDGEVLEELLSGKTPMVKLSLPQLCVGNREAHLVITMVKVTPIFGHSGVEQGALLLQMICETLRLHFAVM